MVPTATASAACRLFPAKKADELKKVLHDYKSGSREATVMDRIAKAYSVEQLDAIADYYASRKK